MYDVYTDDLLRKKNQNLKTERASNSEYINNIYHQIVNNEAHILN